MRAATSAASRAARAFTTIPAIDVRPLLDPTASAAAVASTSAALDAAAATVGFFSIARTGLDTRTLLRHAAAWFGLPDAAKAATELGPGSAYRGWQRLGANVTRYGEGGGAGFARDWHEAIDLYREVGGAGAGGGPLAALDAATLRPSPLHGLNPWPSAAPGAPPGFEPALRAHIAACLTLGAALARGLARGAALPSPDWFETPAGSGMTPASSYWVTRVIHYPPLPPEAAAAAAAAAAGRDSPRSAPLGCGEHTDYGALTLVAADAPGLQVLNAAGEWVSAHPSSDDALVVNIGDAYRVWSAGRYTPTLHRVVQGGDGPRTSVAVFYEPPFGGGVAPGLPPAPGTALPAALNYGRHLESKVLTNFEL